MIGVIKPDRLDRQARLGSEVVGDPVAQEVVISLLLARLPLVPDDDLDRLALGLRIIRRGQTSRQRQPGGGSEEEVAAVVMDILYSLTVLPIHLAIRHDGRLKLDRL